MTEHELLAPEAEPIHLQNLNQDDNDEREYLCPVSSKLRSESLCALCAQSNLLTKDDGGTGVRLSVHDGAHRGQQVRAQDNLTKYSFC